VTEFTHFTSTAAEFNRVFSPRVGGKAIPVPAQNIGGNGLFPQTAVCAGLKILPRSKVRSEFFL
jgi:hypothetical protein